MLDKSATTFRILVPSSGRKRRGGTRSYTFDEAQREREWNRYPSLSPSRRQALAAFKAAVNGQGHAREVLRLDGERLERARALNNGIGCSPLMPAIDREAGPLFRALDAKGLHPAVRRQLDRRMVIVCPLLGLLAPSDMVPDYLCPVGAQIPDWGSLHRFWKPRLTVTLDRLCRRQRVFSFLPARLQALWSPRGSLVETVVVRFASRRPD